MPIPVSLPIDNIIYYYYYYYYSSIEQQVEFVASTYILSLAIFNKGCVSCQSHFGLAIYIKKYILSQKKNYGKFKYFTMQKYTLQKNPKKETKILQDIIITL
jgi:hypothetical protein